MINEITAITKIQANISRNNLKKFLIGFILNLLKIFK